MMIPFQTEQIVVGLSFAQLMKACFKTGLRAASVNSWTFSVCRAIRGSFIILKHLLCFSEQAKIVC